MKYVKKPVVEEAFQFGVDEEPGWFNKENPFYNVRKGNGFCLITHPLSHDTDVAINGDYIIKGEFKIQICKQNLFDATYDVYEGYDPTTHYFPDQTEKPISVDGAIKALTQYKKIAGEGAVDLAFLIRSIGDQIEVVSFMGNSSASFSFDKD
jgi:hypothetical protein